MKFKLSNEEIERVVEKSCPPMSNEGMRLFCLLHDLCGEEEDPDPETEEALGFSTVDTVEKCLAWLKY